MTISKLVLILSLAWLNSPLQAAQELPHQETLDSLQATDLERIMVIANILNTAVTAADAASSSAARAAARAAAGAAAWDAVWDAALDAARGDGWRGARGDARGDAWREARHAAWSAAWWAAGRAARDGARDGARLAAERRAPPQEIGIAAANVTLESVLKVEGIEVTILRAIRATDGWNETTFEEAHLSDAAVSALRAAHQLGTIYTPITHLGAREFVRRNIQNIIMSHPNNRNLAHVCSADFWTEPNADRSNAAYERKAANPGNSAAARFFEHGMCDRSILPFVGALLGNRISE